MRFDDLLLERYGAFERHALTFDGPGLTVVYGPNEAGKSTCLRAIRDFLFKIPEGSPQVATYGSGSARVGATLTTAAGVRLALRRRYGRVRTLIGEGGDPCGDEVLSPLLGSTDRGRFTRLFGLDHDDLRRGGDELLRADGDFGRLIVEAGGGLRALMGKLSALDREIDGLFAPRRKEGREFYRALDAYEAADRALRANTLTSDAHERDVKAHEAAAREAETAKRARREVARTSSQMRRVARVLPMLRQLEHVEETLTGYADVAALPDDYAKRCETLLDEQGEAETRLDETRPRHEGAARRLSEMVVHDALRSSELEIRDLAERAAVARAAREDGPKRTEELAGAEAQLDQLRTLLGLGREVDLTSVMPNAGSLGTVRELADQKAGLDPLVAEARQAVARRERAVADARGRITALAALGADEPFGIGAGTFATLPSSCASVEDLAAAAERSHAQALSVAIGIGLAGVSEATLLHCPSEEQVRAEIAVRDALAVEAARLAAAKAHAETERGAALAEIDSLRRDGEVATGERLLATRRLRGQAWEPIRSSYLGQRPLPPEGERRTRVDAFERAASEADQVADRRSTEAERAAALNQAHRRSCEAEAAIRANGDAERRIGVQLKERDDALRSAFPDLCDRHPEPAGMLAFAVQRARVIGLADEADQARRGAETAAARLAPSLALLDMAERRAGIAPASESDPAARVLTLTKAIEAHDRNHDEHRRETARLPSLAEELAEAEGALRRYEDEASSWAASWASATRVVGLPPDASAARATDLAARWAGAQGDMRSAARMREALSRAAEDEADLAGRTGALAERLAMDVPGDPVAACAMLMERWAENDATRVRRETFAPEVDLARADVERCAARVGRTAEALARAAAEARVTCDRATLRETAARRLAFDGLRSERDRLVDALRVAGDGLPLPALREEAGGLDLDQVRAEVADLDARSEALDGRVEAAIAGELGRAAALRAHEGSGSGSGLAATREGAIADMHQAIERYLELRLARHLIDQAIRVVREERQDPLVREAGGLFSRMTRGEFDGVAADVDEAGRPVVVGVQSGGRGTRAAAEMSDGTRDQLFLAFRLASLKAYCSAAEPLPFVADDILVHFDDERSEATLKLLSEFASTTQVLLFTHHRSVLRVAERLAADGRASIVVTGAREGSRS